MITCDFLERQLTLSQDGVPYVLVTMVDAKGSTPQDTGAKMLVTLEGLYVGTVGGGKLEKKALDKALAMLADSDPARSKTALVNWALNTDVGMTCGGQVSLFFEVVEPARWPIVIFGAGHVAQALIPLLLKLPCQVTCYDSRPEWLARLPQHPQLKAYGVENLPAQVSLLPPEAFVLMMTMGHATDSPILCELMKLEHTFPYVGVIGSAAKAARLRQDLQAAWVEVSRLNDFYCPIGLDLGSNHPEEIAISVAAQLLQARDAWQTPRALS